MRAAKHGGLTGGRQRWLFRSTQLYIPVITATFSIGDPPADELKLIEAWLGWRWL